MDLNTLKEYLNIHLISLIQDLEAEDNPHSKISLTGQVKAVNHILGVINER